MNLEEAKKIVNQLEANENIIIHESNIIGNSRSGKLFSNQYVIDLRYVGSDGFEESILLYSQDEADNLVEKTNKKGDNNEEV